MEGKSLSAVTVGLLLLASSLTSAQPSRTWNSDPSLFLEPNRFSAAKEMDTRSLWLLAGYGKDFAVFNNVGVGLEGLIWSRLRALPDFRFPVETADYFFGVYLDHLGEDRAWRFRISHISSHIVDGADSVLVGGSSSRFSREFVELDREQYFFYDRLRLSIGVRYLFHQVQKIEPTLALPASLSWRATDFGSIATLQNHPRGRTPTSLELFVSTGQGPSWPSYAAGVRFSHAFMDVSRSDLELLYEWGAPWAGTEADRRETSVKLQVSLRDF